MNQSIAHILNFTKNGRSAFLDSLVIRDATFWNVHLVCYAARRISEGKQDAHPEIDWQRLRKLSAELVGDPWNVNLEKVWQCVEKELPDLRSRVMHVLTERQAK